MEGGKKFYNKTLLNMGSSHKIQQHKELFLLYCGLNSVRNLAWKDI